MLSMAGQICLIKLVIIVLPLFYSPFLEHQPTFITRLEEFRENFFGVGVVRVGRSRG